jgi:hypothetical protein
MADASTAPLFPRDSWPSHNVREGFAFRFQAQVSARARMLLRPVMICVSVIMPGVIGSLRPADTKSSCGFDDYVEINSFEPRHKSIR